jgi:hypothetical protein
VRTWSDGGFNVGALLLGVEHYQQDGLPAVPFAIADAYSMKHHHFGLCLMTPAMVHHSQVPHILAHRQVVLDAA